MLKTPLSCIAAALLLAGAASCSSSNNPSVNPLTSQAVFTEALLPANEVPPPTGPETSGSGNATITLHTTTDASGNVTSATIDFVVTLTGFPASTVITAAHIHEAPAGQAAGVEISTGIAQGDVTLTNGTGSFTKTGINVPADVAQRMLNNPAGFYFNVHSVANPNGVARGQLVRTQ